MVRESLSQYIILVRNLTNQSPNKSLAMDLLELVLESEENFSTAKLIEQSLEDLKNLITKSETKASTKWEKIFQSKEIELFKFQEYSFYFKISLESGYLHFDMFPRRGEKLGFANDAQLQLLRKLIMKYDETFDRLTFFSNYNYTSWVLPKNGFRYRKLDYMKYKQLKDDQNGWIDSILKEAAEFILFVINVMGDLKSSDFKLTINENNLEQIKFLSTTG